MLATTTAEARIGKVLNGFDAELQALVNAIDVGRHGKEHWVLPAATFLDGEEFMKDDLYSKRGCMPNNFTIAIANTDLRNKALRSFKDEYLLDFVNIEDIDEEDERVIEQQIVHNIKNFIMALGNDFSFMGNQYRLIVSEKEYFIDLLFFNRRLQALVAIELKRGAFKPEYAGKLNFYLSALDENIKLPHENPSIGIILCRDRDLKTVEFAFRDINKPMGVATFRTSSELPKEYQGILPEPEELRKLM